MRLDWKPFDPRETPLGAILGTVLLACGALGVLWFRLGLPRPACPLRELTGLTCPTCGSTRLAEALSHGDVAAAFLHNPLVFLALAGVAVWGLASTARRWFRWPAPQALLASRDRRALRLAVLAAMLVNWAWVVLR